MKFTIPLVFGLTIAFLTAAPSAQASAHDALPLKQISLPPGFSIEALPFVVPNARQMALTDAGTLIVGTRRAGVVYAVTKALSANPTTPIIIADDLGMPSGVAVHDGDLYIGATHEILVVRALDDALATPKKRSKTKLTTETLTDALPTERHHGWKYLKFGPNGQLFAPVGAPCNICLSEDKRFASLLALNPKTGSAQIWAHGLRNTVGFAWHPENQALWISDNGRDMLGDDIPAEEINIATGPGLHFGYPFVHASGIDDPEFGDHQARADHTFVSPALEIQAHSAALGMTFYTADQYPTDYKNALFVAEHGSWNRSNKVGYRVSIVREKTDGSLDYQPFAEGWLQGEKNWGRPNDVLVAPDGSLLVSDDQAGVIYRISYTGP